MRATRPLPKRHPLCLGLRQAMGGFGLLEVLLTAGLAAAAGGFALQLYVEGQRHARVEREVEQVRAVAYDVERAWASVGSFSSLSSQALMGDGLAPLEWIRGGDGMRNAWGGRVHVSPLGVESFGDAFEVVFDDVPASACAELVSNLSRDVWDAEVGQVSVVRDPGHLDVGLVARECARSRQVAFVFHPVMPGAVAAAPIGWMAPPSPSPATPSATPPGVVLIDPSPAGVAPAAPLPPPPMPGCSAAPPLPSCPTGGNLAWSVASAPTCWKLTGSCPAPVAPPATITPPPVSPPPVLPPLPPTVTACVPPPAQSRTMGCPAGNYGAQQQQRSGYCSLAGQPSGPYEAWETPRYAPWTTTSSTCTACPSPALQAGTQWVDTSRACPAGDYGVWEWQREQRHTRTVSYACPAPTWSLPSPTFGAWSSWADTGATRNLVNTCKDCPAVPDQREIRWPTTTPNCPAGQYGQRSWQYEQARTRSGSYDCPAGTTALPPVSWAPWSAWANTGATRNAVNTCTACPAPATETETGWFNPYNVANCPAGRYGYTTREREYVHSRTRSYDCPAGQTTLPPASISPWGAWSGTGATRLKSTSCTACPAPYTDTQDDWQARSRACPSGQAGSWTWEEVRRRSRTRTYACPAGTAALPAPSYAYGSWSWTGTKRNEVNTCAPVQWYDSARVMGYCHPRDVPVCPNYSEVWFLEVEVSGVDYFYECGVGPGSTCPDPDTMSIGQFEQGSPRDQGYE